MQADSFSQTIELGLLFFPLFIDAMTTLIRRFFKEKNIFTAHKSHLYQRLSQSGLKHNTISTIYISSTLFILLGVHLGGIVIGSVFSLIILFLGIYLDLKLTKNYSTDLS